MLRTKKPNRQNDHELKQALFRALFTAFIMAYLFINDASPLEKGFITIYFSVGVFSYIFSYFHTKSSSLYRWFTLVSDFSATSFGLFLTSSNGGLFLGIYLWMITGYGLRYGRSYLFGSYAFALVGFLVATSYNSFWSSHPDITTGFLITLVLIPWHLFALLNKLEVQTEKAREASQAKSEFLSHISHEIRTPLNGVVGASQLLEETELNTEQSELVTIIGNSSTIVVDLISNVLDLSSIENNKLILNPSSVSLNKLINEITHLLKYQCDLKGIQLIKNLNCDKSIDIEVDALRLKQVLINLISNSIKFTNKGSITLNIESVSMGSNVITLKFSVVDTGVGMSKGALSTIFDSFTQADKTIKEKYGGTGLGLTISNNIIALMGGNITVDSEINVGTRFEFSLDLPYVEAAEHEEIETRIETSYKNNYHILVADDNETNRVIVSKLLQASGHRVDTVNDGSEALDALEDNDYDLMILDSNMPNLSGIEVIKTHHALNPNDKIPSIILSADATIEKINELKAQGADEYLTKPINRAHLLETINRLCSGEVSTAEIIQFKPATKPALTESSINLDRLNELAALDLGNSFMNDLVSSYIGETEKRVKELKEQIGLNNSSNIKILSHTISGSAANIGADKLSSMADLINKSQHSDKTHLNNKYNQLYDIFTDTKNELVDFQQKLNKSINLN